MSPAAFDLSGKVAVVTGGSRGLGLAMARAFAENGAHVVLASRKADACAAAAAQLEQATGHKAIGIGYHAANWADADHLAARVYEQFGRCDVLVNNAGMSPLYPSLVDVSEDLFDKVIGVNLKGPFRLCALIGERMAEDDGGSIINVSSIGAVQPEPTELPYSSAKAALNAMTIGFARAFGPTVRCNVIMPGYFLTDISEAWDMGRFARLAENTIPLRRAGQPDEIVGTALYLASSASSYTTGAVIKVDGGAAHPPA